MIETNPIHPNPDDDGGDPLRRALRRCPLETYEAALTYRRTRSQVNIGPIVTGILARYATPEARDRLKRPDPALRLVEDLGLDSLDKFQAVMLLEEVMQLNINDRALAEMTTLGDVLRVVGGIAANEAVGPLGVMSNQNAMA